MPRAPATLAAVTLRASRLRIGLAFLAAALLACAEDPAALAADGVAVAARASFRQSVSESAPPRDAPGWRELALPDYWSLRRRSDGVVGWYRIEIARPPGGEPWALSLQGDWEELSVAVDGRLVLRTGPLRRAVGAPLAGVLVPLPRATEGAGTTSVAVRYTTAPWRIGYFEPVMFGPSAAVIERHDRLTILQPTLRTALAALSAASGVLLALLGRWDATRAAPWLAAGTLTWSAGLLQPSPWIGALGYSFVNAFCIHAFPVFFTIGLHRRLGLKRPWTERALAAAALAPAAVRLAVPAIAVPVVDGLWWVVSLAIGLYLLRLMVVAARRRSIELPAIVLIGTVLVLAAGALDLASLVIGHPPLGLFLFQFAPGVLAFCTAALLVASLGTRLGFAERLNVELEDRVEARRRELAKSYERMAVLERDRAIAAERERLMRDMHDGTGGALVSAIAMAESAGTGHAAVAEVLRDALADLRLSIDSLAPADPDLVSLLAAARARLEPRFEGTGVRIAWEVREVPAPEGFGPERALQVLRIFQEAVVNAMRHAAARTITVRTALERDPGGAAWVAIDVADDGRGFDLKARAATPGGGRGLGNMRRRAAALGGELAVASAPGGTCVRLRLPVAAEDAATSRS
jgi:signal transduction histidine kinase